MRAYNCAYVADTHFFYSYFFSDMIKDLLGVELPVFNAFAWIGNHLVGAPYFSVDQILLPVGISFYTFQCISYLMDIFRKRAWSSSRLSCGERLLLRCDGNAGILSLRNRERIPHLKLGGGNGLSWMCTGPSCFLSSGDGCVGNFLSCRKGVKDPLEVPGVRCD